MKKIESSALSRTVAITVVGVLCAYLTYSMALPNRIDQAGMSESELNSRYESLDPAQVHGNQSVGCASAVNEQREAPGLTGSLRITVKREDGAPVGGATVFAEPDHPYHSRAADAKTILGTTDRFGALEASYGGLAGQILGADARGYSVTSALIDEQSGKGYDLVAKATVRLEVYLHEPQGAPVRGALVAVSRRALPSSWNSKLLDGETPGPDPRDAIFRALSDDRGRVNWQLAEGVYDMGVQCDTRFALHQTSSIDVKGDTSIDLTMVGPHVAWLECGDHGIVAHTAICDSLPDALTPGGVLYGVAQRLRDRRPGSMAITATCAGSARISLLSRDGELFEGAIDLVPYSETLTPSRAQDVLTLSGRVQMLQATVRILGPGGMEVPRGTTVCLRTQGVGLLSNFTVTLGEPVWLPKGDYQVAEVSAQPVVTQCLKRESPRALKQDRQELVFEAPYAMTNVILEVRAADALYLPYLTLEMTRTSGEIFRIRGSSGGSEGILVPTGKYAIKASAPGYAPCERRAEVLSGVDVAPRYVLTLTRK